MAACDLLLVAQVEGTPLQIDVSVKAKGARRMNLNLEIHGCNTKKRMFIVLFLIFVCVSNGGCGSGSGSGSSGSGAAVVPENLNATADGSEVMLTWSAVQLSDLDSYALYRSDTSGSGFELLAEGIRKL